MKVIHSLNWYFPGLGGGTQVYVDELARSLHFYGVDNIIAAAVSGYEEDFYSYNNIDVFRYPVYPTEINQQIRGKIPHQGFHKFANFLAAQKADIYHQHSWCSDCGIHHLRAAKKLGLATVVTVHVPGMVCLRGTMMMQGKEACDGKINQTRCSTCWGIARGIPPAIAATFAKTPMCLSRVAEASFSNSRLATAIARPALVNIHKNILLEMANLADRIVVVCQWLYDALAVNGVPLEKLVLSRHGIADNFNQEHTPILNSKKTSNEPLKIGFLGRWDEVKGIHILVEALLGLPIDLPVEIYIHGLPHITAYQQQVMLKASQDKRIHIAEPLPQQAVASNLANFDLLAVPSQWMETGPLVVLEAHAVGTPILGSNLGGIAELVKHNVDGWLVPAMDIEAWKQALFRFAKNRELVTKLRAGISPVRTISTVASEMVTLYQSIK